ncbi:MAG: helix-turn-helix domain-containing protein [Bullifex sp.]
MKNRLGLKRKYFISFLCLSLIPLLIFSYIYYFSYISGMKEQTERDYSVMASRFLSAMDFHVKQLESYASSFSSYIYGNLKELTEQNMEEAGSEMISYMLKGYEDDFDLPISAFYYEKGSSVIHTSEGIRNYSDFENTVLSGLNLTKLPFFYFANHYNYNQVRSDGRYSVFFFPVPEYSFIPDACLIFMIDNAALRELVSKVYFSIPTSYVIFSQKGELLFSSENIVSFEPLEHMDIGRKGIWSGRLTSEVTGYTLTYWCEESVLYASYRMKMIIYACICLALTAVLAGLSYLLASVSYQPIKRLFEVIGGDSRPDDDEVSFLNEHMVMLSEENSRLLDESSGQRQIIRKMILRKLVIGEKLTETESGYLAHSDVCRHKNYLVVAVKPLDEESEDVLPLLFTFLEKTERTETSYHPLDPGTLSRPVIIVNTAKESCQDVLAGLSSEIDSSFRITYRLASGLMTDDVTHLNVSYIEAALTLERKSDDKCEVFSPSEGGFNRYVIPKEYSNLYVHAVKNGDMATAVKMCDTILDFIESSNAVVQIRRGMMYDVFNMCLRTSENLQIADIPYSAMICNVNDMNEFRAQVHSLTEHITDASIEQKNAKQSLEAKRITDYVHAHFRDSQLSLTVLADETGKSVPALSRYFKSEVGIGFAEYLSGLRMEWIKDELVSSDRPIREIISDSGYNDVSGVMKKFKAAEGCTMNEYRQNHGRKKS